MNRIKEAFIFLILPLFVFACASTKGIKKPPQLNFEEPILSKGLYHKGTSGIPVDRTTTFSTEDPEVVASLRLKNVSGKHTLRWDWYDPNGNLYSSRQLPHRGLKGKVSQRGNSLAQALCQG